VKLFVDDFRKCPEGWALARTVTEAIRILATMPVEEVSLDHDIRQCAGKRCANRNEVFEPVARYIALMPKKPRVRFHTGNVQAAYKMADIIGTLYDPAQLFSEENYR